VGSIIVTKRGRPFGIITERDLVRGLAKKEDICLRATLLESFASHPLIIAKLTATVEEAAKTKSVGFQ
jgi:CBS domain-containing protein